MYQEGEYDISGTIVGVVDKEKIITGKNVKSKNILIGFRSNGLHTNGYSLARKVLLERFNIKDKPDGLDLSVGEELLRIHRSYLPLIKKLKKQVKIKALSHITGGGILGNTKRVVPKNLKIEVDWKAWDIPVIFNLIQETGKISDEEMRKAFNIGIGLIVIVSKKNVDNVLKIGKKNGFHGLIIGKII